MFFQLLKSFKINIDTLLLLLLLIDLHNLQKALSSVLLYFSRIYLTKKIKILFFVCFETVVEDELFS